MTEPLISIVTPSYNQAEFIRDTLESVRRQTYPTVEHIVMDGGSTDGTLDILREYEGTYEMEWVSRDDEGQSDAINQGWGRADGEFVAWLNSDDVYFDVGALERVARYFGEYDADVIYGDLAYIDQESTVTAIDVRPEFDRTKLPYRVLIGQPATFFRKDVVEAEQLRTDLDYSMDYEYWLRLAERFSFQHIHDVLAGFRAYEAQKSQDRSAMVAELREVFKAYEYPEDSTLQTVLENGRIELGRNLRSARAAYQLHQRPPTLAFDGQLAPLWRMVLNVGPGVGDARKVWRRLRSEGETG